MLALVLGERQHDLETVPVASEQTTATDRKSGQDLLTATVQNTPKLSWLEPATYFSPSSQGQMQPRPQWYKFTNFQNAKPDKNWIGRTPVPSSDAKIPAVVCLDGCFSCPRLLLGPPQLFGQSRQLSLRCLWLPCHGPA